MHIATHGVFVPTNLRSSFLMLGNGEDWRISEMRNIQQHFADISLVVLSACETALGGRPALNPEGTDLDGKEVSSIAQLFMDAGADAIVASLWKVSDASTSMLMQQFYRELTMDASDDSRPSVFYAKALQQAQLAMLQDKVAPTITQNLKRSLVAELDRPSSKKPDYRHPYYWSAFTLIGNSL